MADIGSLSALSGAVDRPTERSDSFIDDDSDFVKLFVGQIPKDMDEDILLPFFSEFGPVAELTIIRDKMSQAHKGCAFLTYCMQQSAKRAIEQLHDKIKLPNAINPLQVRIAESQAERENKLFIGMLPKTIDEDGLRGMFSPYGELREVHIIRGAEGSSKGCAFVKFVDREAAMVAIEDMHDLIPTGSTRPLVVKFADSKKQGKIKDELSGSDPVMSNPINASSNLSSASAAKPDFWVKQYQLQLQQQQQMMYSYGVAQQQVQQQLYSTQNVSMMSYGNPQSQQSQTPQFVYMQQNPSQYYPSSTTNPSFGRSGTIDADVDQMSRPVQQQHTLRQAQNLNSLRDSAAPISDPNRDAAARGRLNVVDNSAMPSGGSTHDMLSHLSSVSPGDRSGGSNQRPPEGPPGANLFIYHLPRDLTDADLATLFSPFGNVISAKVFVDKKTSDSKGFGFVSYDSVGSADSAIGAMNGFQIGSKRLKVQHKRTGVSPDDEGSANIPMSFSHNPSMQVAGMHGMSSIGVGASAVPSIPRAGNQYGSAAGYEFNGEAAQDLMGYVVGNGQGQVPGAGQFPPGPPYGPVAQQPPQQQSRYVYQSVAPGGGQMQHYQMSSQISETEDQAYLYP